MKLQTLSEQVRSPYEKCSAVPLEAGFVLIRVRAVSVIIEIVVVTDVEGGPGIRIPPEQKLTAHVSVQRVVVSSKPDISEPRELVRRAK